MKLLSIIAFFLISISLSAQTSGLKGVVVNAETGNAIEGATITLQGSQASTVSDQNGSFEIKGTPGAEVLVISSAEIKTLSMDVQIPSNSVFNMGEVKVEPTETYVNAFFIGEDEINIEDDNDQVISGLLVSSDDVYLSNVGFTFSPMRFRVRGYDQEYTSTFINGVNFNSAERGRFYYGSVGGLNDVVKNKDVVNGLEAGSYSFGNIGGATNINMKARNYARGGRISASFTNRSYTKRIIGSYSTGLMDNGWAVTVSGSRRHAEEGYIDGTFYDAWSYMLAVEKVINNKHSLSFTTFGAPSERGSSSASFQEVYDLADNNLYNPNWGYQDGKKRNARETKSYEPVAILSHEWNINDKSKLSTGVAARYSMYRKTALNWYNSADPRPDYYRYLPSYQESPEMVARYDSVWRNDASVRQIDWNRLYEVNHLNNLDNQRYGRDNGSSYMIEGRNNDYLEFTFNSVFSTEINDNFKLTAGAEARRTIGMHYKTVVDLLGGSHWLDIDQFAERDFGGDSDKLQNDLNNPNRKVTKDDTFGYDYEMHVTSGNLWLKNDHRFSNLDIYYGAKLSYTGFYREGNMRNGRAPNNSYGKGKEYRFGDIAVKAGGQYKFTGRHILAFNAAYETRAPLPYNAYLSPRIKDNEVPNLENGIITSGDIGYIMNLPRFKGRVTAYYTLLDKQIEIDNYYHDSYRTFMNVAMTGIQKEYRGIELGAEAKLTDRLTLTAIGNVGDYRYINRPEATFSFDNGSAPDVTETIYIKNFHVAGTPGIAGSLGLDYFHPKLWFFNVNANYYDRTYLDISPTRRTEEAVRFPTDGMTDEEIDAKLKEITEQEELGSKFTVDFSVGKLIYFENSNSLSINVMVQNVTNNTDMRTGGFEQGRFDFTDYNVNKFPPRYYYGQGLNFFVNLGYRF
ncbi:MAG: TonB-dependent receptor [Carboxylicivirga sp.]|jgi:hypothetical protein|nr:TonB-dependent receptor [Carboxylicivirga sp.]